MTYHDEVNSAYFEWIYTLVWKDKRSDGYSYRNLLMRLHDTAFTYLISKDENRAEDGLYLRYRFAYFNPEYYDAEKYIEGPCSVLEMMVALAIRCEENIMDNPTIGDRTSQWFWEMVVNLGLGPMTDNRFNKTEIDYILNRFLNREYDHDGSGGLFYIRNCNKDLRTAEIWYQLNWYLDNIV